MQTRQSLLRLALTLAALIGGRAQAQEQLVRSFSLNDYRRILDGQWAGIRYASDGAVYFASSTHSAHHGASFFRYDPRTNLVTMLAEDITTICGEDPYTNPQGKIHSDIVEANGWIYFSTHFSSERPGAYSTWTGAHVIGYQLATGIFRDYGVVHPSYDSYSGIAVDPVRNYLYVFVTGLNTGQLSYLYRIHTATGAKTNLGQVGTNFNSSWYIFMDRRGDGWFSVASQNGVLYRVRGETGVIDKFPNALPPLYRADAELRDPGSSAQGNRWIQWMQPIDGDRAVFTIGWYGGMLYIFDSTKPIGSGLEFRRVAHIGFNDLGLAVGANRVYFYQRKDRQPGNREFRDFHLMSVSLDPAASFPILDHGLLKDQDGRLVWRLPSMATDGANTLFGVGDWWTIPGDLGSLRYNFNEGIERYDPLPRGEFFITANIGPGTPIAAASELSLSLTSAVGGVASAGNRVIFNRPAPVASVAALWSSHPLVASVPASIPVSSGAASSEAFTINTSVVTAPVPVTITASYGGALRTAVITVQPRTVLSGLSLSASSAFAGSTITGNSIVLGSPAPAGGISVSLASSRTAAAVVPASVLIPEGSVSGAFTIQTFAVADDTAVTITAAHAGVTRTANFTVRLSPSSFSVSGSPATVAPRGALTASWNVPAGRPSSDWIGLYLIGAANTSYLAYHYTGGVPSGSKGFTAPAQPGVYEFRYLLRGGNTDIARSAPINVATSTPAPGPAPVGDYTIAASPLTVAPKGLWTVNWTAPAGHSANDWIGLYRAGAANTAYQFYRFTGAAASGSFTVPVPAQVGLYEFRYMINNGYTDRKRTAQLTVR